MWSKNYDDYQKEQKLELVSVFIRIIKIDFNPEERVHCEQIDETKSRRTFTMFLRQALRFRVWPIDDKYGELEDLTFES